MLPDDQIEKLLKHTDPEVAGAAKTLKDLKDSGAYIPKAKFDELNVALKDYKRRADEAEQRATQAATSSDAAAQEQKRLAEERRIELEKLRSQFDLQKPAAEKYEQYRLAKVKVLREKLGDKFIPEYETASVESLDKLIAAAGGSKEVDVDGHQPGKIFRKPLGDQTPEEFEKTVNSAKAGALLKKE